MIIKALALMELDRQLRAEVADTIAARRAGSNQRRAGKALCRHRRTASKRQPAS